MTKEQNMRYIVSSTVNKMSVGPESLSQQADIIARFNSVFYVRNQRYAPIMVGRSGKAERLAGFLVDWSCIPVTSRHHACKRGTRFEKLQQEAITIVATTQTRPEFIGTYWIIREYSTTPYRKVSFTRQDRRTFNCMFKDNCLIWAGRQPVRTGMGEN
ncbi:hypothetical protein [Arsenophonus endosymbiont of Aleurodicus floccissimus]|uniref:hypothetical protein n=1 Tax=Arsenophonus endosymbiont of Aleurodicus floccissimus TaxID=2152761 RepID=UPI0011C3956A|nr:hypothetical protein [Arsenophonus endosymbiont of Aleurodicus floccissimus]